ncbi:MAG: WD40 repeat domain-containing protein [Planctomycetaceae bacterium]
MFIADSNDRKLRFQPKDAETLKPQRQLCGIRFSTDGKQLFAGGCDGRVWRWDLSGDKPKDLQAWDNGGGWVQGLELHPKDGRLFTADSWGALQAWNPADAAPKPLWARKDAHDGWIHALAVSPDGHWLATAGIDAAVRVWSAKDGRRKFAFQDDNPDAETFSATFHPGGKSLVTGDLFGRVRQWDVATGKQTREFDAKGLCKHHRLQDVGGARVLAFDDTGDLLFVAGTKPKNGGNVQGTPTVLVFDWKTGKLQRSLELGRTSDVYVCALAYHPEGFLMAALSGSPGRGKIVFQRPADKQPFYTTANYRNCHSLSLHPGGRRFAVTSTNNGSNGNGRRLKNGEYVGNHSPVHLFDFPADS